MASSSSTSQVSPHSSSMRTTFTCSMILPTGNASTSSFSSPGILATLISSTCLLQLSENFFGVEPIESHSTRALTFWPTLKSVSGSCPFKWNRSIVPSK